MRSTRSAAVLLSLLAIAAVPAEGQTTGAARSPAVVDATTSLASRLADTDPSVLGMFADAGLPTPTPHTPTAAERQALERAFTMLPAVHQRVLRERLRRLSFLDGMPNTALTSVVESEGPVPAYDLTIRAGVLHETVSEFLTNKERTCFDATGSSRTVTVEAGTLEAIVYVLLHEATHMVDNALELTPPEGRAITEQGQPLVAGVWNDRLTIAQGLASPLLAGLAYRRGDSPLPIDRATAVYAALQRTPFASLYGSSNWHDDLAELVTWSHLTGHLGQPYRIVVREAGRDVFTYEPMASPLVRRRLPLLTRFYDPAGRG